MFHSELRLVFQGSIPVSTTVEGQVEYTNLKVFLEAISSNYTLVGQLTQTLERCCQEKKEPSNAEKNPTTP